jgi:ABC-type transport system substrate-binding protein
MNRRALAISLALALVLAACIWWLLPFGERKHSERGTNLVILVQSPPLTIDPVATMELDSAFVGNAAHAALCRLDAEGRTIPVLARDIIVAVDALSAKINLREGCLFWDGSIVSAKDVEASLMRLQKSENPLRFIVSRISSLKVLNPLQLEVLFSKPDPEFASNIANLQASITKASSHTSPKLPYGRQVIGAGAWIPDEFEEGVAYRFRMNKGFPGHGNAETLTFVVKSETQARLTSFQSKEAHLLRLRGPELREALEFDPAKGLITRPPFQTAVLTSARASDGSALMINWSHKRLQSIPSSERLLLVKALSSNLPRASIARTLVAAEPLLSIVPPSAQVWESPSHSASSNAAFRLPSTPELELMAANDSASRELAMVVSTELVRLGLNLKLRFTDIGTLVKAIVKKEHQLALTYFEMPIPGPEPWLMFFDDSNPFSTFGQPLPGVRNEIEKARSILDRQNRRTAWQGLVKDVDDSQYGWIPLFSRRTVILSHPEVSGIFLDACGTPVWSYLSFRE